MKNFAAVVLLAVMLGCTSAEMGKISALGGSQHIVLYANDGKTIAQWDSDGTVHNEENSDGLYFVDKSNGKLVRIAGTFVVTQN